MSALAHQSSEEVTLGAANGKVPIVVQNEYLHRKLVLNDGLQFLDVHLDAPVSGETDHATTMREGCSNCGRQVISHRSRAGIGEEALPLFQAEGLEAHNARGCVSADNDIFGPKHLSKQVHEVIRIQRRPGTPLLLLYHWISSDSITTTFEPGSMMGAITR